MKPRYSGFELNVNIYNGDNKALYCNTDVHRIKNNPEFINHKYAVLQRGNLGRI